jgi:hypothetical protein
MHAATAAAHEREEGPGLPVSAGNCGLQAPLYGLPCPLLRSLRDARAARVYGRCYDSLCSEHSNRPIRSRGRTWTLIASIPWLAP